MKRAPKKFLIGNSTAKGEYKNQEKDGRTLSRGIHWRT
jgi:hypothetical protein